ncbi:MULTISPECIES: shikimate kinase [unclassified Serratia (in: enterobacteria)]|uniref:shikimate kinase n=1 Tax=unclassified Serratia (in: enterobacteria) TaxID=2647522 RepID=UPI00046AD476|nr:MULTISPECIES: shikimate kinase [unclassified Serratia (in: enterobacteria)]
MKVNVVGTSGSGKSTVARQLAHKLAVPYIEMDKLYWRPNWQNAADEEFLQQVEQALVSAPAGWVLDGNYKRTKAVKWRDVDWVVWVDYGFCRTLYQAIRRAAVRAWHKTELWPGTGNVESYGRSFFSRESIIWWTIKTYRQNRKKYLAEQQNADNRHIRFIQLRSPAETAAFLANLPEATGNEPIGQPAP